MEDRGDEKIDVLKLDIEGAEINVLNQMLNDEIYPKYLLIEFDLKLKNADNNNITKKLIKRLKFNGYEIIINDNYNITFKLRTLKCFTPLNI
jgi:hypothetical protein